MFEVVLITYKTLFPIKQINKYRGHRGRDRMAVGFTTTLAISAYHH